MEQRIGRESKPSKPRLGRGRVFVANAGMRMLALMACPGDDIAMVMGSASTSFQGESQPAILVDPSKPLRVEKAIPMGD